MLWRKAWLDSRWRFVWGLGLLLCVAFASVALYSLKPDAPAAGLHLDPNGAFAREINFVDVLSRSFRGFIWVQFVRQNLLELWIVFAVLLGAQGPMGPRSGELFTLSLPVSRARLSLVSTGTNLLELLVLAFAAMLLITLIAPLYGYSYSLIDGLVYAIHVVAGGAVFYSLARLLATVFGDQWRSTSITLTLGLGVALLTQFFPEFLAFSPAGAMAAERYFRAADPAWIGLLIWVCAAAAMLWTAARIMETRDF